MAPSVVKPRVLFVDNTFSFGGAIESLSCLVRGLDIEGVESVIVSGQPAATLDRLFPSATTYSVDLHLPWIHGDPFIGDPKTTHRSSLSAWRKLGRSAYWMVRGDLGPALRLARIGRRHRVDLVHLNINSLQTDGALAARLLRVPCVAHHRVFPTIEGRSVRFRAALPNHNLAVSDAVRRTLVSHGVPEEKTSTVHDAIDLGRFRPGPCNVELLRELGLDPTAPVVGFFGRVVHWKGVLEFVDIVASVSRKVPEVQGLIVGSSSDGPERYEELVRSRVDSLGLGDRIVFAGFRSDLEDLYRSCTVVAHTSIEPEPFGMVIIEAMSCGTPVVAANAGGPVEIIRDGVDGFVADPQDADAFASQIVALISDSDRVASMREAGIERVNRSFSGARYASDVLSVYDRVLGGHRA